jgi:hypothetical protein
MQPVKQIGQFLGKFFNKIITLFSLNFTYFLGIGPTAIIGKIVGKKFLSTNRDSSWEKSNYQTNIKKMF